jgi:2-polyprenyl-3-methyl-5-hydroxy-6-metoxy-1,4-benzoquinol methylase
MADRAARWYETVAVADLEKDGIDLTTDERFDIIVCADVLEHLADPVAVLNRLRR